MLVGVGGYGVEGFLQVGAPVEVDASQEVVGEVEAHECVARVGGAHGCVEPLHELAVYGLAAARQGVAVEGGIDVGVHLVEVGEQLLCVGLPGGVAEEGHLVVGVLLLEVLQLGDELVEGFQGGGVGNDEVLARGVEGLQEGHVVAFDVEDAQVVGILVEVLAQQLHEGGAFLVGLVGLHEDDVVVGELALNVPHGFLLHTRAWGVDEVLAWVACELCGQRGEGHHEVRVVEVAVVGECGQLGGVQGTEDEVAVVEGVG